MPAPRAWRHLRYHAVDHCYLLLQLVCQLVAAHVLVLFALPAHAAYLLTCPRAAKANKTAHCESYFITGASSGIGAALAINLAGRSGTRALHLAGRDSERLQATRRACRSVAANDLRIYVIVADVTAADAMRKHVLAADAVEMEESGGVGLTSVVANAGVASGAVSTAGQSGASTAAPIMNVNLMGTLNTVTPVIPLFAERRRGQIVIVSSVAAFFPGMPMFTSYGASKAAQRHYGECLRIGLEAYGVDVLTVCPSFVQTRMTAGLEGKVPMVSAQRAVSQIADAMCHRTCGTLFVPRKASILTAVYSSLPMHFRALVCRLAGGRAGVDYLASPN